MDIPDEAVMAAARVIHDADCFQTDCDLGTDGRYGWMARAALEDALPYLRPELWDELGRRAIRAKELEATVERLEARGITGMQHRIAELEAVLTEAHGILEDGSQHDTAGRAWAVLDAALHGALNAASKPTNIQGGEA